jgi:hypothetical protein
VLKRADVPVHASQVSQSKAVKNAASALSYLPGSGAGRAAAKQQEAFNRAVGRTFGEDAPQLSDEVMATAKQRIGAAYTDIFSRKAVHLDDEAISRLGDLERALPTKLKPDEAAVVKANIEQILASSQDGAIPGEVYQALRGDLSGQGQLGHALKQLRHILDTTAYRSLGAKDAKLLQEANRQWANMRTAEKSLKQVEGAKGNVRPASLWPIVNQARGASPEMRELARAGQVVLKDPIPDSGTAGRMLMYGALGSAGGYGAMSDDPRLSMAGKGLLLGITAGRVLNSPMAAKALSAGVPAALEGTARTLRPLPYLLPALGN